MPENWCHRSCRHVKSPSDILLLKLKGAVSGRTTWLQASWLQKNLLTVGVLWNRPPTNFCPARLSRVSDDAWKLGGASTEHMRCPWKGMPRYKLCRHWAPDCDWDSVIFLNLVVMGIAFSILKTPDFIEKCNIYTWKWVDSLKEPRKVQVCAY